MASGKKKAYEVASVNVSGARANGHDPIVCRDHCENELF